MKDKTNTIVWTIVAIIVIGLIIFFAVRGSKTETSTAPVAATSDQSALTPPESTEDISARSVDAPTAGSSAPATLSYEDALVTYANQRIQFDQNCAATPFAVTYRNNTDIMIDNRSDVNRTFNIGGPVTVKAWGFKIINFSSATLPATYHIDCGVDQNVATVLLQK